MLHDSSTSSGSTRACVKDGVEAHLQALLAEHPETIGAGLVAGPPGVPDRRSARSTCSAATARGQYVIVEVKRRGEIDGVEQLTRYLELLRRDSLLGPVHGVFAAQRSSRRPHLLAEPTAASPACSSTTTSCAAWTTRTAPVLTRSRADEGQA